MAVVPFVLFLGSDQLNGCFPPIANHLTLWSTLAQYPRLVQPTPHDARGGIPAAPAYAPMYDGFALAGVGAFVVYHQMPLIPGSGGAQWYSLGLGMGADVSLVPLLAQQFGTAPYFKFAKFAQVGSVLDGWKATVPGAGLLAWEVEEAKCIAAAAAVGDTLSLECIVLDVSMDALPAWTELASKAAYQTELTALIARIRSRWNAPNAVVVLVTPPLGAGDCPGLLTANSADYVPGGASELRQVHVSLSRTLQKVGIADMSGTEWGAPAIGAPTDETGQAFEGTATGGGSNYLDRTGSGWTASPPAFANHRVQIVSGTGAGQIRRITTNTATRLTVSINWTVPPDNTSVFRIWAPRLHYRAEGYIAAGGLIFSAYDAVKNPVVAQPSAGGFPIYGLVGDSIAVGVVNGLTAVLALQAGLQQRPASALIFNDALGVWQAYDPLSNANTAGTLAPGIMGLENGLIEQLQKRHPGGFGLVKMGVNASGLVNTTHGIAGRWSKAANEHYASFRTLLGRAFAQTYEQFGLVPDMRGVFVQLLDNEGIPAGQSTAAIAEIPTFLADLRQDWGTRTSGAALPVVWGKPHASSNLGSGADRTANRAALDAQAAVDSRLRVINADDYELSALDGAHDSFESSLWRGRRMVLALAEIESASGSGGAGDASGDSAGATDGSSAAEGATAVVDDAAAAAAIDAALAESPDVAAYTTENGRQVTRRSVAEMEALADLIERRRARRDGTHRRRRIMGI